MSRSLAAFLYFGYTTLIDLIRTRELTEGWNALPVRPDRYFCGGTQTPGGGGGGVATDRVRDETPTGRPYSPT